MARGMREAGRVQAETPTGQGSMSQCSLGPGLMIEITQARTYLFIYLFQGQMLKRKAQVD